MLISIVSTLLTAILILNVFGQNTPTISYVSQEQVKDIGDSVSMVCTVQGANEYPIIWYKFDQDLNEFMYISVGSALVVRDSRFSIGSDPSSSKFTLHINDIKKTDDGMYRCGIIISATEKITADVSLLVRQPPIIIDNTTLSFIASEGSSEQMECYAFGYPLPTITWKRENGAALPTGEATYTGNILKFSFVRKEDRGTYYCIANNGIGKGDRRNINLEVEFAPVITVIHPNVGQALHNDINLGCNVEAYPPPAIFWIKETNQLHTNQDYTIFNFATDDAFTTTTLRVISIEKHQYGDYYCRATNKLGMAENQVHLYETSIPTCPLDCDAAYNTINIQSTTKTVLVN